jgi:hypothetical protein
MLIVILSLLGGIAVAHLVGIELSRRFGTQPGHARELMPTLPPNPIQEGTPEMRWNRSVRRVERRLLKRFADGVEGVDAQTLAADMGENPELVNAALERLREELPCRLRVRRDGTMLHDFDAEDIQALSRSRRRSAPFKLVLLAFAAFANIGAAWPIFTILFMAIVTLDLVLHAFGNTLYMGGFGIFLIGLVGAGTMILSAALHRVLEPMIHAPDLAAVKKQAELPDRSGSDEDDDGGIWLFSGSSSGGAGGDSDGGGEGLGQAIIIIVLIAIIVICVITIVVWIRGLWRAINKREERNLDRMSPAFWLRTTEAVDGFEKWVPTNDLVTRVYRALRRAFSHRRAVDGDLGPRVLILAKKRGGVVSALEIALHEGLDLDEASEVGSMLTGIVGGRIEVTDAGDLAFVFPPEALDGVDAETDEDMWAEYVDHLPETREYTVRRDDQATDALPVNLVGLNYGHLVATDRLVGGTWLLALTGTYLMFGDLPNVVTTNVDFARQFVEFFSPTARILISAALVFFAIGSMCLSATARYTARQFAAHGVARDARRVAMLEIRSALGDNRDEVDLTDMPDDLVVTLESAWPNLSADRFVEELDGVLVDLDVSPSLDAEGRYVIELDALRSRLSTVDELRDQLGEVEFDLSGEEAGEVIFDTRVEHEKITALA